MNGPSGSWLVAGLITWLRQAAVQVGFVAVSLRAERDILPPHLVRKAVAIEALIHGLIEELRTPTLLGPLAQCPACGMRLFLLGRDERLEAWHAACGQCGAAAVVGASGGVQEFTPPGPGKEDLIKFYQQLGQAVESRQEGPDGRSS